MFETLVITGVGVYHPENEVDNNYFIEHFLKKGIDIGSSLVNMGRDKRFLSDNKEETVITMAKESALEAIEKAKVNPNNIDMLIFATDSPEYLCPSNALMLNAELGTNSAHYSFDMNTSCTGMLYAIDVACKMMQSSKGINKALIVGSLLASLVASEDDPAIFGNFADASASIILERVKEDHQRGFIDSACKTDPFARYGFLLPKKGFSSMYNEDVNIQDKKFKLTPFNCDFIPNEWCKLIKKTLDDNNYEPDDVSHFFFSQYAKSLGEATVDILGLTNDHITYVGDKYGYTGVTSPIIAYYEALQKDKVKDNEKLVFCSVGAGYNAISLLYKQ